MTEPNDNQGADGVGARAHEKCLTRGSKRSLFGMTAKNVDIA